MSNTEPEELSEQAMLSRARFVLNQAKEMDKQRPDQTADELLNIWRHDHATGAVKAQQSLAITERAIDMWNEEQAENAAAAEEDTETLPPTVLGFDDQGTSAE